MKQIVCFFILIFAIQSIYSQSITGKTDSPSLYEKDGAALAFAMTDEHRI